jgi:hypothetical protein
MLSDIIQKTSNSPKIVNDQSNFVVVTYWWGRGNMNQNTARPCIAFFEGFIQKIIKTSTNTLNSIDKNKIPNFLNTLENDFINFSFFNKIIDDQASTYMNMLYEYCQIIPNEADKDHKALIYLDKLKQKGKTPLDYEFKNLEYVKSILNLITKHIIKINKDFIFKLFYTNNKIQDIKMIFFEKKNLITNDEKKNLKKQIDDLTNEKKDINLKIKQNLNKSQTYDDPNFNTSFQDKSIFQILNQELRFLNPIKYEEMIDLWESKCELYNCNHMAVEYPEFAQKGGYQLAINAKPLFIQKALELCHGRAVLYIDGDMYIRKYPEIFDLKDVDFMARGWWIDPRSSCQMEESITFDPYTFETSGGTMFFSPSKESKILIDKWIKESDKPYQQGKADDRILSLIFNTNKFLCNMKIIQLPIEYLWLSLDYDERMMDLVYDHNYSKMNETIFIEHPECLTSEDTASGQGASSDRTPKFYSFLEENINPVSEEVHEYIMFPDKKMTESFKSYYDYMDTITYLDDGNELLVKKEFVHPGNPDDNEMPLYVIRYDDKFGKKNNSEYTNTQIAEINIQTAKKMNIDSLNLKTVDNYVEIQNADNLIDDAKMIRLIIRLLTDGKNVLYNPIKNEGYDVKYADIIKNKYLNSSIELTFIPIFNKNVLNYNEFYKPLINISQPILFKPTDILIKFLSMFLSLNQLSEYLNNGSYEFMSRIRVGYVFKPKINVGGGDKDDLRVGNYENYNEDIHYNIDETMPIDDLINEYMEGFDSMYVNTGNVEYGGKRKKKIVKSSTKKSGLSKKKDTIKKGGKKGKNKSIKKRFRNLKTTAKSLKKNVGRGG